MAKSTASASSSSNNTNVEKRRRRVATAEDDDEDDKTARALLTEEGFDPNDLKKRNEYDWTPICYYSYKGNVTMIRYLLARGADCRKSTGVCSPMFWAAFKGHLEIMKLLFQVGGAHEDIRKINRNGATPLRIALYIPHFDVVYWLLLNGALSPRQDGVIDDMTMRNELRQINNVIPKWDYDKRLTVLAWAQDTVTNHENMKIFLKGTILSSASFRRHPKNEYATRSNKRMKVSSPLVVFKGTSGILELIADFVAGTPQQVRSLHQLLNLLSAFIADVPFVIE